MIRSHQPPTIDATYEVIGEKPRPQPFFGPWQNIVGFVLYVGSYLAFGFAMKFVIWPAFRHWFGPRIQLNQIHKGDHDAP